MVNINLEVFFLGTSASVPTIERNTSSVALKYGGEVILFDCGEGTQRQIIKTKGISFMKIKAVFITHFHGDHYLGLPGLLQTMTMNDRKIPIKIYGPSGSVKFIKNLLNSGYVGIGFPVDIHEIAPGEDVEFGPFRIKAFKLEHHNIPTLGYVFQEKDRPGRFNKQRALELGIPEGPLFRRLQEGKVVEYQGKRFTPDMVLGPPRAGRKVVYAVDTVPTEDVVEEAKGADILIHDSTGSSEIADKVRRYGHTTASEAAEIALKARVGHLILTHISPRYEDAKPLLNEARTIFPKTELAHDLMVVGVRMKG